MPKTQVLGSIVLGVGIFWILSILGISEFWQIIIATFVTGVALWEVKNND